MLIPLLIDHPQMMTAVLRGTPAWVWGLLAALVALGAMQLRNYRASLVRVSAMPVAMTAFALWGMAGAFASSPLFGEVVLTWMLVAAAVFAAIAMTQPPRGTAYDPATRSFALRGSVVPLLLILAVFLTRYVVNVDIAMQPALTRDATYSLIVGAIYGCSTGLFAGRAARLWRMAFERTHYAALVQQ